MRAGRGGANANRVRFLDGAVLRHGHPRPREEVRAARIYDKETCGYPGTKAGPVSARSE